MNYQELNNVVILDKYYMIVDPEILGYFWYEFGKIILYLPLLREF